MANEVNDGDKSAGADTDDAEKNKSGKKADTSTGDKKTGGNAKKAAKSNDTGGASGTGDDADADEKPILTQSQFDRELKKRMDRFERKQTETKDLSEREKAEHEAKELREQLSERDKRDNFIDAVGVSKRENALKLYKWFQDDIDFDDKGKITNASEIRKMAKDEFPQFFQKLSGDGDGGDKTGGDKKLSGGGDMNTMLRRKTGRG